MTQLLLCPRLVKGIENKSSALDFSCLLPCMWGTSHNIKNHRGIKEITRTRKHGFSVVIQWKPLIPCDPVKVFFSLFFLVKVTGNFVYFLWAESKQSKLLDAGSTSWIVISQSCSMWQLQVLGAYIGPDGWLTISVTFLGQFLNSYCPWLVLAWV